MGLYAAGRMCGWTQTRGLLARCRSHTSWSSLLLGGSCCLICRLPILTSQWLMGSGLACGPASPALMASLSRKGPQLVGAERRGSDGAPWRWTSGNDPGSSPGGRRPLGGKRSVLPLPALRPWAHGSRNPVCARNVQAVGGSPQVYHTTYKRHNSAQLPVSNRGTPARL
jgi:hypothetical protein